MRAVGLIFHVRLIKEREDILLIIGGEAGKLGAGPNYNMVITLTVPGAELSFRKFINTSAQGQINRGRRIDELGGDAGATILCGGAFYIPVCFPAAIGGMGKHSCRCGVGNTCG